MRKESCGTCRYSGAFSSAKQLGVGFCRIYPPKAGTGPNCWPLVTADQWCAMYEPRITLCPSCGDYTNYAPGDGCSCPNDHFGSVTQ